MHTHMLSRTYMSFQTCAVSDIRLSFVCVHSAIVRSFACVHVHACACGFLWEMPFPPWNPGWLRLALVRVHMDVKVCIYSEPPYI